MKHALGWSVASVARRSSGIRHALFLGAAFASLTPAAAHAHGGEAHGDEAHTAAAREAGAERTLASETAAFSAALVVPLEQAGGGFESRVFLADATTSAPVGGAGVTVELKGAGEGEHPAQITDRAGVYRLRLPPAADGSTATVTLAVTAGEKYDLVPLGKLTFGPPAAPPEPHTHSDAPPWLLATGAVALAVFMTSGAFLLGRRSGQRASLALRRRGNATKARHAE